MRAIFKDKFLLLAAFFILLPTGFKFFFGIEGQIFIARPDLPDPNFAFTVLYMIDHSIDGAEALILNRPYPDNQKNKLPHYLLNKNIPIYWGGSIDDQTHVVVLELRGADKPTIMKFDNWIAQNIDILEKIENSPDRYRIYVGHAKWQSLQYEMECISNAWVLGIERAAAFKEIFSQNALDQNAIWLKILYISDFYKRQAIKGRIAA